MTTVEIKVVEGSRVKNIHEIRKRRRTLQETMNFMAALSAGIEPVLGRGANSMTMSAGRNLGRKFSENAGKTDDLLAAIDEVGRVLENNHCLCALNRLSPPVRQS